MENTTIPSVYSEEMMYQTQIAPVDQTAIMGMMMFYSVFWLVLVVYMIVVYWKIFKKAGQPGWKVLIPLYNTYTLLEIINRPWWWLLLLFIPFVNIVIVIIMLLDLGKSFGKTTVWSVFLLVIFSIVGVSILAFSKSPYQKIERK